MFFNFRINRLFSGWGSFFSRRNKNIFVAVFLIIFLIVAAVFLLLQAKTEEDLPDSFLEANAAASQISRFITNSTNESVKKLEEINLEHKAGNYEKAFYMTIEEIKKNNQVREQALLLSNELQKMAASAQDIKSPKAQQLIIQAISSEIALVTHLLIYNEYWNLLLENLKNKFLGLSPEFSEVKTSELIEKINNEVVTINELNRKYHTLIEEFKRAI